MENGLEEGMGSFVSLPKDLVSSSVSFFIIDSVLSSMEDSGSDSGVSSMVGSSSNSGSEFCC